jgi:hypothetical protein
VLLGEYLKTLGPRADEAGPEAAGAVAGGGRTPVDE